jgi:hypothetical protein
MCTQDSSGRGADAPQLNSELQQAQLELLNAHCATHQLRLRYSADDLVRFGRRDILRKSAQAASDLHDFYSTIVRIIPADPAPAFVEPTPSQVTQAIGWLATYLSQQRKHYAPMGVPLSQHLKAAFWPYFSPEVLDEVRIVELRGARVGVPDFYTKVRALGFEPPEIAHMDSLTFLDVVVFNQELNERSLFHALVHAVQIRILGLEEYAELWVRSFIRCRAHFTVPLEVHAFSLASKFLRPSRERFSVEDHVLRWITDRRY